MKRRPTTTIPKLKPMMGPLFEPDVAVGVSLPGSTEEW